MAAWFPFYFTDYSGKTEHLSLTEHGAYLLLMGNYYKTGKPLPANAVQLQRICRAFDDAERDAMKSVLDEFFILTDEGYIHERILEELEKSNKISQKRSEAAKKRHANAHANASASAPPQAHTTTTTTTTTNINKKKSTKRKVFKKPTIDEIRAYCDERSNNVDPERFFNHYESNGWRVGRNPMKDWKAAVITWERNDYEKGGQNGASRAKQTFDKLTEIGKRDIEKNGFTDKLD